MRSRCCAHPNVLGDEDHVTIVYLRPIAINMASPGSFEAAHGSYPLFLQKERNEWVNQMWERQILAGRTLFLPRACSCARCCSFDICRDSNKGAHAATTLSRSLEDRSIKQDKSNSPCASTVNDVTHCCAGDCVMQRRTRLFSMDVCRISPIIYMWESAGPTPFYLCNTHLVAAGNRIFDCGGTVFVRGKPNRYGSFSSSRI